MKIATRGLRIDTTSWRGEARTARGIPFVAERALRTPRVLARSYSNVEHTRGAEPVRDAALLIGLALIATALLIAGFAS